MDMLNFIEELKWRGMLHDMTPGTEELINNSKVVGYIGFDPTAQSLTIGNYVQIMLLKLFQLSGHKPIILMGGATGRIGDPSFKDKERELKSYDIIDKNLQNQIEQIKLFLDFEGPNAAILVNNLDFYKNMNVLDFLRDVGKTLTVSYMMSKDSVKNRLETGLSFTEFSYQLLQSFDFQVLYDTYNCVLQMGGSDQWGNITSGTEFIRRNINGKAYAVTTPLLTKADGSKFGKSEEGNIWLDPSMTSPYKFYQFWINADDADMPKYLRYFSLKSREEIESFELEHKDNPRLIKQWLAEELTIRVHGEMSYKAVMKVSDLLFGKIVDKAGLQKLTLEEIHVVSKEIPTFEIPHRLIVEEAKITEVLTNTNIFSSNSEVRKAIQGNALSINKEKIQSHEYAINQKDLLYDKYVFIDNGKKNKYLLIFN